MAKNQVVTIDIGTATIKILHIERIAGGLHLIDAGVIPNTAPDDPQQVAEAIKQLWGQLNIKHTLFNKHKIEIALALPRSFVVTKRLPNLPPATPEAQLPAMVAMAAETELPFQVEESVFTYHDVQRTPEAVSVELVSTRRETVTRYIDTLKGIGISPSAVIPSMFAIATVARNTLSDSSDRTIIVDIGAGQTDFCLMHGKTLQFSRSFSVSGNQLTQLFMSEMQIESGDAEQEKQQNPADQVPTRTWTRRFIAELARSIDAAERESNGDDAMEIAEIRLCGGGARVPELAQACQQQLQIPTRVWNLIYADALETSPSTTTLIETHGDTFAVPLGIGIHLLDAEQPVSLLPQEVGAKRAEFSRKRQQLIAAGVGGLALFVIALGGITWSRTQNAKEDFLDTQIANFEPLQNDANKQLALELILADKLTHHITPIDILHTLSTLFKDRTKVAWKTFEVRNLDDLKKTRITFSLQASSHPAINSMHGVLGSSKLFSSIETGEVTVTGDERKLTFEVKITCQLTNEAIQMFAQKRHPKPVIEIQKVEVEGIKTAMEDVDVSPPPKNIESPKETSNEEKEEIEEIEEKKENEENEEKE